ASPPSCSSGSHRRPRRRRSPIARFCRTASCCSSPSAPPCRSWPCARWSRRVPCTTRPTGRGSRTSRAACSRGARTSARGPAAALPSFPGPPPALPGGGTLESGARLTRGDVVKFHRERFRPDATVVAVVGAVTVDEARREVLGRFGSWARPASPLPGVPTASAGREPREEVIPRDLTQATIMFGRQAIRQTDPDYFALVVASYVLGGGSASRLYTRVREEGGLAYSVYSYVSPSKYGSAFFVSAQTRIAEVPKVRTLL